MFRHIANTAVLAVAVAAGSSAAAQADIKGTPQASPAAMQASLQSQLKDNAFGWQFAIAQNGKLAKTSSGLAAGTAVSSADTGGASIGMQPTQRMELMSATKTFTAVSTLKLLRAHGITIETPVAAYLPAAWPRSSGFKIGDPNPVRFRHLLTHTSGINQKIIAANGNHPAGNGWDLLKWIVATGTKAPSARQYKNANYAMLSLLNAELWKRSGGAIKGTVVKEVETVNWKGDEITKKVSTLVTLPVDKATMSRYALDHMQKRMFEPIGIQNVSCTPASTSTSVRAYVPFATQQSNGSLLKTAADECAGHRGLRMSTVEMVQFLAHLRHGTLVDPADRALMDSKLLGWDTGSSGGVYRHGGDVSSPGNWAQVHTCLTTFPDGTEAAIIVNSQLVNGAPYQCTILRNAWNAAR